jgi:hypothetical protein
MMERLKSGNIFFWAAVISCVPQLEMAAILFLPVIV